ncbi:MAG TPA: OmpA family protein [Bdellovibrionales bacterium]|nr:OmpA family protein [Bdellovibrionales bacterium]
MHNAIRGFTVVQRVLISIFAFCALNAFANENNVLSLKPEIQRGDLSQPQGLWPFLGGALGAMDSNDSIRTGGVPTHMKILGSYYFETAPWVADAGIGIHNQFLTQNGRDSDTIQSLYTELAGRYELSNRWQLGALWSTLVDNPDRYRSNTDNLASFIGVQVLKEFNWDDTYLVRAGGRAMTDVGISGETIDTVMAEIQVSFGPKSSPAPEVIRVEEPAPQPIAPHLAARAVQTFEIDPRDVNFDTDSTKLVRSSQPYMRRLARALADNRHLFDKVEIVGHADQRGTDSYNDRLSERRAQTIANSFIASGVSRSQIITDAKGKRDLLSRSMAPAALQRNRRVQLEFHGVKNQEALKNIIDAVQR